MLRTKKSSPLLPLSGGSKFPKSRHRGTPPWQRLLIMMGVLAFLCWGTFAVLQTLTAPRVDRGGIHHVTEQEGIPRYTLSEVQQVEGVHHHAADEEPIVVEVNGHHAPCDADTPCSAEGHRLEDAVVHHGGRWGELENAGHELAQPLPTGLYAMTVVNVDGERSPLSKWAGQVALVVNVASQCGYTDSNYKGLQKLYDRFKARGFVVMAFPCNQFGNQEPGNNKEVQEFARTHYGVTFPVFAKVEVNGPDESPIFQFLKQGVPDSKISWNFSKFLVNRKGEPVKHYESVFDEATLVTDIEWELGASLSSNA
eukprot:jgi/Botrbrau1/5984/Bobra.104_1s0015.1